MNSPNTKVRWLDSDKLPSSLKFAETASLGRRYPEPPHPYRPPYQRDRDRIIHARAFRRLEHKTQVFTAPLSDHFRNRLTHTIEVAQIARTVATVLGLNEDLVESLALCHDIGHPPFGHAGEVVLDKQMQTYGERFNHNLHALRIVESFEQRYAAFPGLNLTFEVREGIVKHSCDYNPKSTPELDEYLLNQRPPLEAQLIDLADQIAYNCADLDDAIDAGLLNVEIARREVDLFDLLMADAQGEYPRATKRQIFNEALRRLLNRLVSGLVDGTKQSVNQAAVRTTQEVRLHPKRLASLTPETAIASAQLVRMLHDRVYRSQQINQARSDTSHKVTSLFELFMSHTEALPLTYRKQAEREPPHRVVCEYIAGMTDKFLLRLHEKLLGSPNPNIVPQ